MVGKRRTSSKEKQAEILETASSILTTEPLFNPCAGTSITPIILSCSLSLFFENWPITIRTFAEPMSNPAIIFSEAIFINMYCFAYFTYNEIYSILHVSISREIKLKNFKI